MPKQREIKEKSQDLICDGCHQTILNEPHLVCCDEHCLAAYHLEICCGPNPPTQKSQWKCPKCRCAERFNTRKSENDSDLRASIHALTPEDLRNVTTTRPPRGQISTYMTEAADEPLLSTDGGNLTSDLLATELRLLREELKSMKEHLAVMSNSLSSCNERLDNVVAHLTKSDARLIALEERDEEISGLKNKLTDLQEQLSSHLQESLKNELEIVGIPETPNESLIHTVKLTATKTGVTLEDGDIDWTFRAGPKRSTGKTSNSRRPNLPRPIVVRFVRRTKRDEFLKAAKSRKHLTTEGIDSTKTDQKIYINERLTRENRLLFRDARSRYAAAGFQFCWIQNGFIFIRRREGSPPIRLRSQADLTEKLGGGSKIASDDDLAGNMVLSTTETSPNL